MNGIIKVIIIAGISISIGGCSGTSGESNTNASTANVGTANQANNSTVSNTNPEMIPYPGTENTNGAPPMDNNAKVLTVDPKQLQPTNPAVPGADNSEVITALNEKGAVETRTFKGHPVLAKVERTTAGRDLQLKVFLKNGKVVNLPPDKIKNFTGDSAQSILQAIGISAPKPPQTVGTGAATGTKTEDTKETIESRPPPAPNAPPVKAPTKP
jgi:hypothetical protein